MKTLVKTINNIDIYFEALEEYVSLDELLPDDNIEQLEETYKNNVIFCAKVSAEISGLEISTDYLGGCIYKSYEDFYNTKGCYFDDMAITVLNKAKEEIPNLLKEFKTALTND